MRCSATTLLLCLSLLPIPLHAVDEDYRADAATNQRPMLGVEMSPVPTSVQDREGITPHQGVLVQSVYGSTAASTMGIQRDDVILGVNGQPIGSMSDLRNEVGLTAIGDPIEVQITRNGQRMTLTSAVKPWPDNIPYEKLDPAAEKRFRDWQDRRQKRIDEDVADLQKQTERLRKHLTGEDPILPPSAADSFPELGIREPAFRFSYRLDSRALQASEPLETTDQGPGLAPVAVPSQPWRVRVSVASPVIAAHRPSSTAAKATP